ncbi:serine protease [Sphingomonas koreensis]|nr:serine protease [Sphingomonas koreensis]
MRLVLGLSMLLAACAQPAPQQRAPDRIVEPRAFAGPAPRGDALLKVAMLSGQNAARAAVGVAPLMWNDALAADARRYADQMARTGRFAHAEQPQGLGREGENLWTGTRDAYRYREMVDGWIAEKRYFKNGVTPDFSTTGNYEDVAHYTQIIWRGSSAVGCAMASNSTDDYLVCRYSPPGNVVGQKAL